MRIRKQPRQLPACRENFLPCMLQEISREGGKIGTINFVAKTLEASSSPSEVADQMKTSDASNYLQEQDDDNPTRHYVRRGQRNGGASIVDVFAAIPKTNSYELCDRFPGYSEKKTVNSSCNRQVCNMIPRSAIPCDSDVDDEADHPSREPEGSLLHSLYLQLLAAGREGISLRGLFASFESQTSLPKLASNWREQVKTHLKSGPYFEEVKGRYLLCEFLVQPQSSKRTVSSKRKDRLSESLQGAQTRRKAPQKTVHEAFPSESVPLDFQFKLQRQKMHSGASSIRWDLQDMTEPTQFNTKSGISSPIRVTKPVWNDEHVTGNNIRFGGAIPGSLKAMQARIIAETGVQVGVRCARKDGSHDSSKWQCPMMAMEGHTLCEHHSFLNERKRARYAKARRQGDSRSTAAGKSHKPVVAMKQQQQDLHMLSPGGSRSEVNHNSDSDDLAGLDEVASQALLTMKSDILAVENLDMPDHFQPFQLVDRSITEEATKAKSQHHLAGPQFFARSPTGRFIAAKKTAVKIPALNSLDTETSLGKFLSVPCTRPPSIPPLPAFYGPRRKTVKNRSLLSIS